LDIKILICDKEIERKRKGKNKIEETKTINKEKENKILKKPKNRPGHHPRGVCDALYSPARLAVGI
jgi:hypothetical protein